MTTDTYPRLNELQDSLEQNKFFPFLDTIDSLEEFETVKKIVGQISPTINPSIFPFFTEAIKKHGSRRLGPMDVCGNLAYQNMQKHPCGKIIYYRFFDYFHNPLRGGIDEVAEYILQKIKNGESVVLIDEEDMDRENLDEDSVRFLSYFTQYPVTSLRKLLLPGLKTSGFQSKPSGIIFEWKF